MNFKKNQNKIYLTFLLAIFLLIATFGIGKDFPPGLNHDAAWNGLYSLRILNNEPFTVYTSEAYGKETLFHYVLAGFFYLLGTSKETIEATTTLFGLISVPLIYLLLNQFTKDKLIAFLLSLMFVTSSALVLYSRAGWRLITLIPFVVLITLLSYLYINYRKTKYAFWLGVSSALTLYTYNGGRSIAIYFLFFWTVILFESKKRLPDFLYSFLAFITVSMPILIFAILNTETFFGRAEALYNGLNLNSFLLNLKSALLFFNVNSLGNDFFTNFPVLEGPISILWIIGIFIAFLNIKKYWVFLTLFIILLIPSVITTPSFHRAVGTLPIVYFFGFIPIFEISKKYLLKKKVVLLLILIIVCWQSYSSLSKLYIKKQPFMWGFYPEATEVGRYLKTLNSNSYVIVYAENWPIDTLAFMSIKDVRIVEPWFKNYQSYNTVSKDGIKELIVDLSIGKINKDSIFVVDILKEENFINNLQNSFYNPKKIKPILYNEKNIAYIYKL